MVKAILARLHDAEEGKHGGPGLRFAFGGNFVDVLKDIREMF